MSNLEEAIRERAYHLWIADGQPEGKADIHWMDAQREILATSVETFSTATAMKPPKGARYGRKGKTAAA